MIATVAGGFTPQVWGIKPHRKTEWNPPPTQVRDIGDLVINFRVKLLQCLHCIKQADGTIKSLTLRQVADLLGHTTSEVTELYYVKRDLTKLNGVTDGFEL